MPSPYDFARAVLFRMDAEKAHEFALHQLKALHSLPLLGRRLAQSIAPLPTTIMGLTIQNPVGLAAGLDKNGAFIDPLASLGFGFLEVGTVTPKPQDGNPKPRLFRLPEHQCIINRMGFNNHGLAVFIDNVRQSRFQSQGGVLGLNLGKNASTPIEQATQDYLTGLAGVYPYADYVTINISSPNTQNLRALQGQEELNGLLGALAQRRAELAQQHQRYVPIAVKIAPDMQTEQVKAVAELLQRHGMDGVIATNTTLSRDAVQGHAHAQQAGGLSGPPVHALSLQIIRTLRESLGAQFSIIGVGGISNGQHAVEKIQAGANAVQLYTGLVYQGPALVKDCVEALRRHAH